MAKKVHLSHPGVILKEMFLDDMDVKPAVLARALGVTRSSVSKILSGQRDVTAETSLRLGLFFDQSPEFWLNLQKRYDIEKARMENMTAFRKIVVPYTALTETAGA